MGLIGITYKARIRPNEESYLVMNSDGSMEVANSGNIEPAKYTFLFILQENSEPPLPLKIQSVPNTELYITGHPNSGTVDGNIVSGSNYLSVWYKNDLNDGYSQLYLKVCGSGEDLYLCIEGDNLKLKKKSTLLDDEGKFKVEPIII